ncbi:MAG: FecR domain-containing protein [Planctomycetota bacterium]|nr:FecR domain-containing protein [Planctomycetota bacterium]
MSRCYDEDKLGSWLHSQLPTKSQRKIENHLMTCSSCQTMVEEIKFFEGALASALVCPDPEDMAKWLEGRLDLSKARSIQNHISDCDDCQEMTEIVEAALEAELVAKPKNKAKRGQTRAVRQLHRKQSGPNWFYIAAPLAAAALILFFLSISQKSGDTGPNNVAKKKKNPKPVKKYRPDPRKKSPKADPDKKIDSKDPETTPDPVKDSDPDPDKKIDKEPETNPDPEVKTPDPDTKDPERDPKTNPSETPKARPDMDLGEGGGALALKKSGSSTWSKLQGTAKVGPNDVLMARGDHAHFTFSNVQVTLRKGSVASLHTQNATESRLKLEKGEALFAIEDKIPGHTFIAMAGKTETAAIGTRFLVKKGREVTVYVEVGQVSFEAAGKKVKVNAGQAFKGQDKVTPKAVRAPKRDSFLGWTDEALQRRVDYEGFVYPQNFLASTAAKALVTQLKDSNMAVRARALFAFRALQSQGEFAALATMNCSDKELGKVQKELFALDAGQRNSTALLSDLLQAHIYQAFTLSKGSKNALKSLAKKHPSRHAQIKELSLALKNAIETSGGGIGPEALIALKLSRLCGLPKLDIDFWSLVAARNVNKQGTLTLGEHITLLILPRKLQKTKNAKRRLELARIALPESIAKEEDLLLQVQLTSVLAGAAANDGDLSPMLRRIILEDLTVPAADRALLASRAFQGLLIGLKKRSTSGPRILIRKDKAYVSFSFKPQKFQKQVFLCGSWDNWHETKTPMTRQKDGSFKVLIPLERARYEYKFRMGDKDNHWYTDPSHKLQLDDTRGATNSLLDLR